MQAFLLRQTNLRHKGGGTHAEALASLKIARQLAIWFYRTFKKDQKFSPGAFVPPPDPAAATQAIHEELARLRKVLEETQSEATRARVTAEQEQRARLKAEEQAAKERAEREIWEKLAQEADSARATSNRQLATQQAAAEAAPLPRVPPLSSRRSKPQPLSKSTSRRPARSSISSYATEAGR
jgi:type I restriction enzyme R subunit